MSKERNTQLFNAQLCIQSLKLAVYMKNGLCSVTLNFTDPLWKRVPGKERLINSSIKGAPLDFSRMHYAKFKCL